MKYWTAMKKDTTKAMICKKTVPANVKGPLDAFLQSLAWPHDGCSFAWNCIMKYAGTVMALDDTIQPVNIQKSILFPFPMVPMVPMVPLVPDFSPQ